MRLVVAAVIEREDRRLLIGQRRRHDYFSAEMGISWRQSERRRRTRSCTSAGAARRTWRDAAEMRGDRSRKHRYADTADDLEICFYAAAIAENSVTPKAFEQIAWVLPKELAAYDFLAANARLVADLATGRIKPGEMLSAQV